LDSGLTGSGMRLDRLPLPRVRRLRRLIVASHPHNSSRSSAKLWQSQRAMSPWLPTFDKLPLRSPGPPYNAWGLWGQDDELGRLNLITPAAIKRGREEIKEGIVVNLK
jgi:hypothetical protein